MFDCNKWTHLQNLMIFGRYKLYGATCDMMPILSYWKRNTLEGAMSIITYDTDWQAICKEVQKIQYALF